MRRGLLAGLACIVLAACGTSAPIPISTPAPTQTVRAQPSTPVPASPTTRPTLPAATGTPIAIDTTTWRELTEVATGPSAREDHTWTVGWAVGSTGDRPVAYLFGGRTADGPANDLWSFDLDTYTWTELHPAGPAPAPRFGHTATMVPGVGLVVWSGQGQEFFDDVWAYDPAADAWHDLPSLGAMPEARYGSCASLGPDGRLWISHGFTQDDGRFADTRAYDFANGEWADMTPSGDVPVKRCLHDCYWSTAGTLILYGGQTTGVPALGDTWSFDPDEQSWTQGPESDAPPRQLYALANSSRGSSPFDAIAFGGGSVGGGYLSDLVQISSDSISVFSSQLPDSPGARSGATLIHAGGIA
ncbi:MAG: hypothetical protein QOJ81_414, partial [Chloroflexota bacterium]|nr:hypothetical protein [Chloroflexota bacterium]